MSSPVANSVPSAVVASPIPSVVDEAVFNEGFDHVRDQTPNGYVAYGTRFSESEPTYMQVQGWDQTMLFVTNALSLEWAPLVL